MALSPAIVQQLEVDAYFAVVRAFHSNKKDALVRGGLGRCLDSWRLL